MTAETLYNYYMAKHTKTVVTGISGGVDSAVAALLLKQQGYDVIGLFMNNWEENDADGACTSAEDWADAQSAAAKIGIPVYSVNFAKEYYERVFSHFLSEYKAGRTPNPDVLCNREIKFDEFARYARELGADYIATGHYCDITHDAEYNGKRVTRLLRAADTAKDQTYFLNQVRDGQLDNVLFPLGKLRKPEVRAIAESYGLTSVAKKKDSTGVCFIGERNFKKFLSSYLPAKPGPITDEEGNVLGTHDGLMYYTLGQRRGLGIGGHKGYAAERWFVIRKDIPSNTLIVSCGEDDRLLSSSLKAASLNFIGGAPEIGITFACTAKTRYRQPDQACSATVNPDGTADVVFDVPQRAITPGQYVVFYDDNRCMGGGVIL